jgi:hypothetical protein
MLITDAKMGGEKLVEYLDSGEIKKVVLISCHGVGDQVMFMAPVEYLKKRYPNIQIDVALSQGLQEEFIFPNAILMNKDWKEFFLDSDYDLVFACNFPLEDLNDLTKTKSEVCCEQELGIPPIWGHLAIQSKPLVGTNFCNTSVSWIANTPEDVAQKVWNEIIEAGCIPIETTFQHIFYNETSKKFDFVDNHVRNWPARLDTCISLIEHCDYFIGAVNGNWHIALSVLPYTNVCLLEKDLKVEHFTKLPVKGIDVKNYKEGSVKEWLEERINA